MVDLDRAAAERRAAESGLSDVAIGTDLSEMPRRIRADIVFDVVVPSARPSVVETALSHGCNVLSEKPMADSLEDARALVQVARRAGRLHAVVQNRRYNRPRHR